MADTATTTESDSGPLQTALTEEPLANDATTQPDEPDTGDPCPAAPPRPRKRAPISPVLAAGLFGAAVIVALATVFGGWDGASISPCDPNNSDSYCLPLDARRR